MSDSRPDGSMALFIGVSRSGKSVPVKRTIEKHKRVIAFDPKGEYKAQLGFDGYDNKREFFEALRAAGDGPARICLIASDRKSFDFFCDCAFNFNRAAPAVIVCEELAAVTNTNRADGAWGRLINQGLAYNPIIIGTVQRGQEVDKSLMNNAQFLHITKHNTDSDAEYIAAKLGLPVEDIPREPLEFIQWTSDKGLVSKGKVDFKGAKSANWQQGTPRFLIGGKSFAFDKTGRFNGITYK